MSLNLEPLTPVSYYSADSSTTYSKSKDADKHCTQSGKHLKSPRLCMLLNTARHCCHHMFLIRVKMLLSWTAECHNSSAGFFFFFLLWFHTVWRKDCRLWYVVAGACQNFYRLMFADQHVCNHMDCLSERQRHWGGRVLCSNWKRTIARATGVQQRQHHQKTHHILVLFFFSSTVSVCFKVVSTEDNCFPYAQLLVLTKGLACDHSYQP